MTLDNICTEHNICVGTPLHDELVKLFNDRTDLALTRQELADTKATLADAMTRRDHYRAELKTLQAVRTAANRRKARRLARQMVAEGNVC